MNRILPLLVILLILYIHVKKRVLKFSAPLCDLFRGYLVCLTFRMSNFLIFIFPFL